MYCVCCWVSPILKTDPSLSVNQASAKIKDKLFLAGFEYKSRTVDIFCRAGTILPFDEGGKADLEEILVLLTIFGDHCVGHSD